MDEKDNLKLRILAIVGDLEKAKDAHAWITAAPVAAPVQGGIGLTDEEVMKLSPDELKETAMLRLAAKQNNPQPPDLNNLIA
jgi:hypothetical protein